MPRHTFGQNDNPRVRVLGVLVAEGPPKYFRTFWLSGFGPAMANFSGGGIVGGCAPRLGPGSAPLRAPPPGSVKQQQQHLPTATATPTTSTTSLKYS